MKVLSLGLDEFMVKNFEFCKEDLISNIKNINYNQFLSIQFLSRLEKYYEFDILIVGIDEGKIDYKYDFDLYYKVLNNVLYYIETNINLKKVIFVSSYGVYKNNGGNAILETNELYSYDYLESLFLLYENMLRNVCDFTDKTLIILRAFNIFSIFQDDRYIVKNIIQQIFSDNENLILGDSRKKRDFVYIKDFMNLLSIVMKKDFDKNLNIYNVGSGKSTSLRELVDIVKNVAGINKKLIFNPEKIRSRYDFFEFKADMHKVKSELNYECLYSLEDGLKELIELYEFKGIE